MVEVGRVEMHVRKIKIALTDCGRNMNVKRDTGEGSERALRRLLSS